MHLQMRGPIIYNADHSNSVHWMSNFNETFLPKTSNDFKRIFKLKAIKESDESKINYHLIAFLLIIKFDSNL